MMMKVGCCSSIKLLLFLFAAVLPLFPVVECNIGLRVQRHNYLDLKDSSLSSISSNGKTAAIENIASHVGNAGSLIATEEENGTVGFIGHGDIELTISTGSLTFDVCPINCTGEFRICYKAEVGQINDEAAKLCSDPSQCGVKIIADEDNIRLDNNTNLKKSLLSECHEYVMKHPKADFVFMAEFFASCNPKFDKDGNIKLQVIKADSSCPIKIKDAIIKKPVTTTTSTIHPSTTLSNAIPSSTNVADAGFMGNYWWIILIIVIIILIIPVFAIGYWCYFERKVKKARKFKEQQQPKIEENNQVEGIQQQPKKEASQKKKANNNASIKQSSVAKSKKKVKDVPKLLPPPPLSVSAAAPVASTTTESVVLKAPSTTKPITKTTIKDKRKSKPSTKGSDKSEKSKKDEASEEKTKSKQASKKTTIE